MIRKLVISALIAGYLFYRYAVLGGMGGYSTTFTTFSLQAPFWYAIADLWPALKWPEPLSWQVLILLFIITIMISIPNHWGPTSQKKMLKKVAPLIFLLLVLLAFCVTLPLNVQLVFGRAESRTSYLHLFVLAIMIGIIVSRVKSRKGIWVCRILSLAVLLPAIALQQEEIGAWKQAGEIAHSIITQTQALIPDPPMNSTFVYYGVPLVMKNHCYVFGIGLSEAIEQTFGREDIRVVRFGTDKEKNNPTPKTYLLDYNWKENALRLSSTIQMAGSL